MTVILKDFPDLKKIITAAFPDYRKRKASVHVFRPGININSYWSGGTKYEWAVVQIDSLQVHPMPSSAHPYFDVAARGLANKADEHISIDSAGNVKLMALPEGFVLVSAGWFCGKPATATIYVHPANMPRSLVAGGEQS